MQKNKKQPYEALDITVTRVELENSICAGSVDVSPSGENNAKIEAQNINQDFGYDFADSGWDSTPNTNN